MPLADHVRVANAIGARRFKDATEPLRRVREVKSEREVAKIRESCAIAGRAFARVPEIVFPGQPLSAVFRAFQIALLEEGADWVAYLAAGAGPGGQEAISLQFSCRPRTARVRPSPVPAEAKCCKWG
jgi:Xaa-Pro aminopeptidase